MADQAFQLVVRRGPRPGQTFPLTLQTVTLGRDPLSDIVINDPEVSRHHARFTLGTGGYELQDMGSTNGSFVDGKRLTGDPVALQPAQLLMFGSNVTLVYQATSEADPMATMVGPGAMQAPPQPEPEPEAPVEPEPVAVEPEVPAEPEPFAAELQAAVEDMTAEPEPEEEPSVEPVIEEPAVDFEMPAAPVDASEELPEIEDIVEEDPGLATMMEGPIVMDEIADEPEPLPTFDEPPIQTEPLPALDQDEPVDEPIPPPPPETPTPVESFEEPEPVIDSGEPLPDFEPAPAQSPAFEPASSLPPDDGPKDNKIAGLDRNVFIAVVVIILLCCCCLLIVGGGFAVDAFEPIFDFFDQL